MFDWINCDYPLPNGKPAEMVSESDPASYQTKDLDNGLDVYRITADGRLLFERRGEWGDNNEGQYIEYTGKLSFYYPPYTATFEKGQLTGIVEGWGDEDERPGLTVGQLGEFVRATMPDWKAAKFLEG